ncbi:MAG: hypothetical protein AAF500_16055 [Myxococcota bacterium]
MLRRELLVLLVVLGHWVGTPRPAAAWTRAMVESANATVEVRDDAETSVFLDLRLRVHAGWVNELEIATLGSDVVVDPRRPPYLRAEDGEVYRPETELTEDGRIRLSFERRGAPRKGEYRVLVRYRAKAKVSAVPGTDEAEVVWSLPAWETGLHDVTVDVRAPRGSVVPNALRDSSPGVTLATHERPRATQFVWRRIHLPRHTPWNLRFRVNKGAIALPTAEPALPTAEPFTPLAPIEGQDLPWSVLVLALLVLVKRRAIEVTMGPEAHLVRLRWPAVLGLASACVGLVMLFAPSEPLLAIPVLALMLHRPSERFAVPDEHGWRVRPPSVRIRRETPLGDLLDGTQPVGWIVGGVALITIIALGQPIVALAALPVFLTGTGHHRPPTPTESEQLLAAFISDLRLEDTAPPMGFCWEAREGSPPRCRIVVPSARPGLLSLSCVAVTSKIGCVAQRRVMLLVQTRAQSDADDLVRRATASEPDFRAADGRLGRLIEWGPDVYALVRSLECRTHLKPVRKATGSWLLRQMGKRTSKAA